MKTTKLYALLLMLCVALGVGFTTHAQLVVQIGEDTLSPANTLYSPLYRYSATTSTKANRSNILYTEAELAAKGILPGAVITNIAFNKKNAATLTNPARFEIFMGTSNNQPPLATNTTWASLMAYHTQVYATNNIQLPNVAGWVDFPLSTAFVYLGGSLEISTELDQAVAGSTDAIKWEYSPNTANYVQSTVPASTLPATLSGTAAAYKHRPNIRITYSNPTNNDAAVASLVSPINYCQGNNNIVVNIENRGSNVLNNVVVNWSVNNVLQTPVTFTTPLASIVTGSNYRSAVTLGTYNFPATATTIKVWSSSPNGAADANNGNDTLEVTVKPQLSGIYTVDPTQPASSSNYLSIAAIADDLNTVGVCGPVTINVSPVAAGYNAKIEFREILGASAVNHVRINGNGAIVNPSTNTTNGTREAILLNGTKYLTIDSLIIRPTGTSGGWGILMTGGAQHDSILNCHIDLSNFNTTSATYTNGILVSGNNSSNTATAYGGSNIVIKGNKITGATGAGGVYHGISLGNGGNDSITVVDNEIENFYYAGIYLGTTSYSVIANNNIHRTTKTAGFTSNYAIYLANGKSNGTVIDGNTIHDVAASTATYSSSTYGIYSLADADSATPLIIRNNLIYNYRGNLIYAIGLSAAENNYVFANTINIDGESTGTSVQTGLYATGVNTGSLFKNNNVSITKSNLGNIYGFYYAANTVFADAQANNFYVNSATTGATNYYGFHGASFANKAAFNTAFASLEINGMDVDPQYNNVAANDYTPNNPALIFTGEDLTSLVPTDYLGNTRNVPPTIGAFEKLVARVYDLATAALVRPLDICMGVDTIVVNVTNVGGLNVDSFTVNWSIDNVLQTPIQVRQRLNSIISPTGKDVDVTLGAHNFGMNPVALKVWVSNPNNTPDTFNLNDTLEITLQARMGGTYTVNPALPASNTNFQSLTDFADRLSAVGVCAPVIVNVAPNSPTFVGKLSFTNYPGASNINTVRIHGNGNTVSAATANTNGSREILLLSGVSYLTIDSLNFITTGTAGWGALITSASKHDSIINCTFDLSNITATATTSNAGIIISGSNSSATTAGLAGANLYFGNNKFLSSPAAGGMYYGIAISTGGNDSIVIENNTFSNIYSSGIYANATSGTIIRGNVFDRSTKTAGFTSHYPIQTIGAGSGMIIENNIIRNHAAPTATITSTSYGIYVQADADSVPNIIRNNVIHTMRGNLLHGIYVSTASNTKIAHNTIHLDVNTNSTSINSGIYATGTNTDLEIYNNNIVISGGGTSNNYGFYYSTAASVKDAQRNNVYYMPGATGIKNYGYYTKAYATQADFYRDYPALELGSPNDDPMFANVANNDLRTNSPKLQFNGKQVLNIVDQDILGVNRSVAPTIGAYEEVPNYNNDLVVMAITKPVEPMCADSQDVYAVVANVGLNPVTSFDVNLAYDGGTPITRAYTVTLDTLNNNYTHQDTFFVARVLMNGIDKEVKVWTSNPNGQNDDRNANDTFSKQFSTTEFYISTVHDTVCLGADVKVTFYPQIGIFDGDLEWYESNDGNNYSLITGQQNLDLYYQNVNAVKYIKAKYVANGNNCETTPVKFTPLQAQLVSVIDNAVCKDEDAYVVAKTTPGSKVLWFADSTSITPIGRGDTLFLREVDQTSYYYAQAGIYDTVYKSVGPKSPSMLGTNASANVTNKMFFDVNSQLNLKSVDVFATVTNANTGNIIITDEITNQVVGNYPFRITTTGLTNAITVPINEVLPPGKYSMMRATGSPNLVRNSTGAVYPYGTQELVITGTDASAAYFIYFYNWQYELGCVTDRIQAKVEIYPTPVVDLGGDIDVCKDAGSVITLDAENPGFQYLWDDNSTNQTREVNKSGTYYVKAYNQYGCNDSDTINVNIKANPVSALSSDTSVCIDVPVVLNAGNDGLRFYWNTGHTSSEITATDSGNYVVFITGRNGCVVSDTVHIAYNGLAPKIDGVQIRNQGPRKFQFNPINPRNVVTYEWDFGDGTPRSTDANPVHEYASTGNYAVVCYISSSCGTVQDTMTVHILSTSINQVNSDHKVKVYPNPATDHLMVEFDQANIQIQKVTIINVLGQQIETNEFKSATSNINLNVSRLAAGTYQLLIETNNGIVIEKFIKSN